LLNLPLNTRERNTRSGPIPTLFGGFVIGPVSDAGIVGRIDLRCGFHYRSVIHVNTIDTRNVAAAVGSDVHEPKSVPFGYYLSMHTVQ